MADEPKIIIDEDWKSQVQREKEEAQKTVAAQEGVAETGEEAGQEPEEANPFMSLVHSLAAQCLLALGAIAPPDAKQITVDIEQARYLIDTLMMLREKTKGNLTPEEEGFLTEALAELQRGYVVRAQQVQDAAFRNAGVDPKNLKHK
ncbi:MAG: DUF1844 domain-containing protein [Rhodopirellula sp.]|nr:DUF1844 domain-containing protein [Rhodopirellula sp.]